MRVTYEELVARRAEYIGGRLVSCEGGRDYETTILDMSYGMETDKDGREWNRFTVKGKDFSVGDCRPAEHKPGAYDYDGTVEFSITYIGDVTLYPVSPKPA